MPLKQMTVYFCHYCGNPDYLTKPNKKFCSEACRQAHWNMRVTGGFKLYEAVMAWRIDREKGDFQELTAIADQLAAEERILRRRRAANIERERASLPAGVKIVDENLSEAPLGRSRSRAVAMSPAQQDALRDAGEFVLAYIVDRIPNDPDRNPKGWSDGKKTDLQNGVITLGGDYPEAAE